MSVVNSQYDGTERRIRVISSEYSEAGSWVMVDTDGEHWRCLASNDGTVEGRSLARGR